MKREALTTTYLSSTTLHRTHENFSKSFFQYQTTHHFMTEHFIHKQQMHPVELSYRKWISSPVNSLSPPLKFASDKGFQLKLKKGFFFQRIPFQVKYIILLPSWKCDNAFRRGRQLLMRSDGPLEIYF